MGARDAKSSGSRRPKKILIVVLSECYHGNSRVNQLTKVTSTQGE
jgi:hypothetical protein